MKALRWYFADEDNAREQSRRTRIRARIDDWWRHFGQRADRTLRFLKNPNPAGLKELVAFMRRHLDPIHPLLAWEFGRNSPELVISPEAEHQLRPLVDEILRRSPPLRGWRFHARRPPRSLVGAETLVRARTGGTLRGLKFHARLGEHRRIDLGYRCPGPPDDDLAFVAAETLLGEEVLNRWIGAIEAQEEEPKQRDAAASRGLNPSRLATVISDVIAVICDHTPKRPWHAVPARTRRGWKAFQCPPVRNRADYPGWTDMTIVSGADPDLVVACHDDPLFCSERYTRHGERFAYLKIDNMTDRIAARDWEGLERRADRALRQCKAGAVIGQGAGKRYSYSLLALLDVPRAANCLRETLRKGRVVKRSWIQFYDFEWRDEWIGIWDDTPPPPASPRRT